MIHIHSENRHFTEGEKLIAVVNKKHKSESAKARKPAIGVIAENLREQIRLF
jgi:hypothetical protein